MNRSFLKCSPLWVYKWVSHKYQFSKEGSGFHYCPNVIISIVLSHSQQCTSLDKKLYDHPIYKTIFFCNHFQTLLYPSLIPQVTNTYESLRFFQQKLVKYHRR